MTGAVVLLPKGHPSMRKALLKGLVKGQGLVHKGLLEQRLGLEEGSPRLLASGSWEL